MKRPEPSIAYRHYYKPFTRLINILNDLANTFDVFKEVKEMYELNPGDKKTTLELPFIKKDSNFGNSRIVFSRHHFPKEQAEHVLEKTMTYSLYEINECINVSLTILHALQRMASD